MPDWIEPWLDVEQIAKYLALEPTWIYNNWKASGMPIRKVGKYLRAKPSHLDEWVESAGTVVM